MWESVGHDMEQVHGCPFSFFCRELKVKNHLLLLTLYARPTKIIRNRTKDPINIFNARSSPICSYVSASSILHLQLHLQSLMTLSDKLVLPFHLPIKAQPLWSVSTSTPQNHHSLALFPMQAGPLNEKKGK